MLVLFRSPTENLDAMIAMQTKNKLGKSLALPDITELTGKQPCDTSKVTKILFNSFIYNQ